MWGKLVFWLRLGAVGFVGLVVVGAALQKSGLVTFDTKIESAVWIVGLAVLAIDNAGTLGVRSVQSRRQKRKKDIEGALMSLLIVLAKGKKLRFEEIGASVYTPRRWQAWSHRKAGQRHLKRIHRFRPAGFPLQSGITWHSKNGTVGESWTNKKMVHWDGVSIAAKWDHDSLAELTEDTFQNISVKTRQGFSLEQFRAITGKYSEILASPIWDVNKERTIIGVLTVDRALVTGDDGATLQLGSSTTRETVEITCRTLGTQLRSKSDD